MGKMAILGLGAMGYGIASSVLRAGHETYGFDVVATQMDRFRADGGAKGAIDEIASDLDAAITASFVARDGLRATWAYRSLVARNLVLDFIEEQTQQTTEVA